ncbi:YfiR family protein [Endozoicomonas sp. GU-1]|uniref:YfiR family protein n=1 Tax=Endozoicomonas sp. GU-1 TaxID=3009078 RepID=UPI0022B5CFEF|nr:YfiR family protein [Endozoicomonas sp. GU-1]WBA81866.1 YfiR family protein [Endozoicomonas sp. GU-1]WBA84820.1 YfiR family protein [Endozoicomonas sp. GU-1]
MPIITNKIYAIIAIALLCCLNVTQSGASEVTKADKVKAAIVYKLSKFVAWPGKKQTLALCIIGSGAINSELQKINHKFSRGRRISVTHKIHSAPLKKLCDIVYIHNSTPHVVSGILQKLKNESVLTISDSENFAYQGGVIGLIRTGSRIQFAISQSATRNASLSINAQLMGLAKVVK